MWRPYSTAPYSALGNRRLNMSHFGTATYYNLCTHGAGCGGATCGGAGEGFGCGCDDNANHVAYAPTPQTGCTSANGYGCNGYLNTRNYCDNLGIYSDCVNTWINPSVRDCPCFNAPGHSSCQYACWMQSNDCLPTYASTLVDLTTYAWVYLGFSTSVGRVGVTVYD